jgi:hypothetical protein
LKGNNRQTLIFKSADDRERVRVLMKNIKHKTRVKTQEEIVEEALIFYNNALNERRKVGRGHERAANII